jgi:hypothetical protein
MKSKEEVMDWQAEKARLAAMARAAESDVEERAAERKALREMSEKVIRAGSRGLIKELGLSQTLPVDVAMRKRIVGVAKKLRAACL